MCIFNFLLSNAIRTVATALLVASASVAHAQSEDQSELSLDAQLQALKKEALALNRDLFILEEELLFPSSTQVAVYVSLDVGEFFSLDAVKLSIDGAF